MVPFCPALNCLKLMEVVGGEPGEHVEKGAGSATDKGVVELASIGFGGLGSPGRRGVGSEIGLFCHSASI